MEAVPQYRLLVLAGFFPESTGGGVVLRGILADYPAELLLWYNVCTGRAAETWWRPQVTRRGTRWYLPGKRFSVVRRLWASVGYKVEAVIAAHGAAQEAARFRPDVCWAVLDHHALFAIRDFARASRVPLHVSIHDDPAIASRLLNTGISPRALENALVECLRRARSRDCISARMAAYYRSRYGVDCAVLTRGIDLDTLRQEAPHWGNGTVNIALAGAPSPGDHSVEALLLALDQLQTQWGVRTALHVFGGNGAPREHPRVYPHPPLTDVQFATTMRTMHLGFASDPQTEIGRQFAATSFPTKVVTYLGFGLPFVYIGPGESTVRDLLNSYGAGVLVESQNPSMIAAAVGQVLARYEEMQRECRRAAVEQFDIRKVRDRALRAILQEADQL